MGWEKQYSKDEWVELVDEELNVFESNLELRKAYSFESAPSNLLEIFAQQ